jgi:hypothetical protein
MALAEELIESAAAQGVALRLLGSLAVRRCCGEHVRLLDGLGREPCRDVDLVGLGSQSPAIRSLLEGRGYTLDASLATSQEYGVRRLIFRAPQSAKVDVFLDGLDMSHHVPLAERLELDSPTITPVDLLLSKLQVHELTLKDVHDSIALLAAHELGGGGRGSIEIAHLVGLLSADWGFCHTATTNLDHLREHAESAAGLDGPTRAGVLAKIAAIKTAIDEAPKAMRWRARARVGTRVRWWEEVADADS